MKTAEAYANAIRAALAYTGQTQSELARRMGIHEDTLGRKLRKPRTFTLGDLIEADKAVGWTKIMEAFDEKKKRAI